MIENSIMSKESTAVIEIGLYLQFMIENSILSEESNSSNRNWFPFYDDEDSNT